MGNRRRLWAERGRLFISALTARFPPGWTEGLPLSVVSGYPDIRF